MALSKRQLETLADLQKTGFKSAAEVIKYCQEKIKMPHRNSVRDSLDKTRPHRRHSKKYYQEIIEFLS
jgi:hypothetical protein